MANENLKSLILVVDDEVEILKVLTKSLEDEYRILTASRPSEALQKMTNEVAVVISDQRMPEMFGAQLLRQIREIHPNTVRIIMSGYSDMSALIDSVNQGEIFRYIQKPWDLSKLMEAVSSGIKRFQENCNRASLSVENQELKAYIDKMKNELSLAHLEISKLRK